VATIEIEIVVISSSYAITKRLNKECILSFFVVIRHHLLPLMNYLVNGQYHKVQPIVKKFTERCI
jgi:hypothetical protein